MSVNQTRSVSNSRVKVIPARHRTSRNVENFDGQKKKIAAYARVSTMEEHQSGSYELQVEYYTDYIQQNPAWELYKVFADEGITGTSTKNRAGFLEMIEDAKAGKIDYIITKSISRFARNTLDCLSTVRMLKNLPKPCGIYFEKENLDTLDSKSELFLTILSSMAQEESRSISENTKWGVQKRFSQGKPHIPTTYFLGYDTDEEGEIFIDEAQAEIVRRIYKDLLDGRGTPTIAKNLTKEGLKTARGNKTWTSDAVYKILRNEKYMGHCLAQKSVTVDFLTHKRVRNKDHQPQYFIRNTHPAIISEEDWYAVQEELDRRNKMLRDPDEKYRMCYSGISPFSNRLFCGECGRPVTRRRMTSTRKGQKYYFTTWHCRAACKRDKEFQDCNSQYVWEAALEIEFMKALYELKQDKENLIADVNEAVDECSLTEVEEARLQELENQIEQVSDQISQLSEREMATHDPLYEANLRHLIYEQEILQMEHDGLYNNKQESIYLQKNLEMLIGYLYLVPKEDTKFNSEAFVKTIERVIVYRDHEVEFIFKCGAKRTVTAKRPR